MALQWKSGGGTDLPDGGTTGQALVKKSNANQDVEWGDAAGKTYTAGDGIDITNDVISADFATDAEVEAIVTSVFGA